MNPGDGNYGDAPDPGHYGDTPDPGHRRMLGALLVAAGIFCVFLGWGGVSGASLLSGQIPYVVSGGLWGIGLIGVGLMLLIESGLARERVRLDRVEAAIRARRPGDGKEGGQ